MVFIYIQNPTAFHKYTATGGELELNYNNPKIINLSVNYNIPIGFDRSIHDSLRILF